MAEPRLAAVVDDTPLAQEHFSQIANTIDWVAPKDAEVVVVVGGDGFMLQAMHRFYRTQVKLYGINAGTVGFLLNSPCINAATLSVRLAMAVPMSLIPLRFEARDLYGETRTSYGFNEISIFRETRQALKLSIDVDGVPRLLNFVGDGVLLATPAGSTALNMSVGGPVLPLDANLLSLAATGAFRPRRWPGALISRHSVVSITVLDPQKRPASVSADFAEFRDLAHITISESSQASIDLLFDPEQTLGERIIKEQFIGDDA
ncbi:MAG: NAD kinase [Alphaproteobacteria bacterium]|nr:NAD kinase [Alphaproteobacteria bacterium]